MQHHSMDRSERPPVPARRERPRAAAAARGLVSELFQSDLPAKEREHLAETFAAAFGGAAFSPLLLDKLQSGDEDERVIAALALGARGNCDVVPALIAALEDAAERVRRAAARALGEIAAPEAADALLAALAERPGRALELEIVSSLRRVEHPRGEEALVLALAHEEVEVQLMALAGLRHRPCAGSLPEARRLLSAEDARVRAMAVAVLERAGDPEDLDALAPLLGDADVRVRALARDAAFALERRAAR